MYRLTVLIFFFSCSSIHYSIPIYANKISEKSESILILGDTQKTSIWEFWRESNEEYRSIILNQLASENPAFIIHLGDLVFQGSSDSHWQEFDKHAKTIRSKQIPLYPVLGNHEYYGNNKTALDHYFKRFTSIKQWYSYTHNDIGFIHLNSNFSELSEKARIEQNSWYQKTLNELEANQSIKQIIVSCHQPPYTNSTTVSGEQDVQSNFVQPFQNASKTILFLSGHSHSYEHFKKGNKHFVVSGGGGGPRQTMQLENPKHQDLYVGSSIRPLHYLKLLKRDSTLELRMIAYINETWVIKDSFNLSN